MKKNFALLGCVFGVLSVTAIAGDPAGNAAGNSMARTERFDYPELTVVPRASERLRTEAESEDSEKWTQYLPIQISAISTLAAGIATYDSASPGQSILGMGVGAGWLILTSVLTQTYHPYSSGWARVKGLPKSSLREELAFERRAEEELRATYAAGERMRWLSITTQLGASVVMLAKGNGGGGINLSQGFQIGSALLALAPLIFPFHSRTIYTEQMEYKKKIYGPIARPTLLFDKIARSFVPGVAVSFRF